MKKTILSIFSVTLLMACHSPRAEWAALTGQNKQQEQTTDSIPTTETQQAETSSPKETADEANLLPHTPVGIPQQLLYRTAYTVSYNETTRNPNWVAWVLTADHVGGPYTRKGINFREDKEVTEPRAKLSDYANSGWSRGHMCPSADNKWNQQAQEESFLLTNMCPQSFDLNAGDWEKVESACRKWAKCYGKIYIVSGPIYNTHEPATIGKSHVCIPDAFFKVVMRTGGNPAAIGYIYSNHDGETKKPLRSVDEIEKLTGYDFFSWLEDSIENKIEAKSDEKEWKLVISD